MLDREDATNLLVKKYRGNPVNDGKYAVIITFPNGKEIATDKTKAEKQTKTFSLIANALPPNEILRLPSKTYPKGGKEGKKGRNSNVSKKHAPTLWWKDHDTWRIYIETRDELEIFINWYLGIDENLEKPVLGSNVKASVTYEQSSNINESEQAVDEIVDAFGKYEYPIEDIQQRAIKTRRGQADFRKRLLDAYGNKCAVTGCEVHSVLEAAHIISHAEGTDYEVGNGLLLRADIHTLFDLRLLAVSSEYRIHISRQLDGSEYENLRGQAINLPRNKSDYPSPEKLAKHFEVFDKDKNI